MKCLACWSGLHTLVALRAGAKHVTAVERWLYLSLATKQSLVANGKQSLLQMVINCHRSGHFQSCNKAYSAQTSLLMCMYSSGLQLLH